MTDTTNLDPFRPLPGRSVAPEEAVTKNPPNNSQTAASSAFDVVAVAASAGGSRR
jgi:hypothetical protein